MDVQILSDGSRYTTLPQRYIRPVSERPNFSQVSYCDDVPIIDIGSGDRLLINRQIGDACRSYGFFQVINHGVPAEIMEKVQQIGQEFFELPVEEKMKLYSGDPSKRATFGTGISYQNKQYHNWRDYLRLHCYPLDRCTPEWPSKPPHFKELVESYCMMVRHLGMRILESISESFGLEKERIIQTLGDQSQYLTINRYPVCPEPELTYGLSGHTDPYALTILLQDTLVSGLQILIDRKWFAIRPCPNAFIINIGDLQGGE